MIHPDTQLRFISPDMGYGVFATRLIPKGTLVYVRDALEIALSYQEYRRKSPSVRYLVDKFSYIDRVGDRVMSWDFGKYVNHNCTPNAMTTGYGFEVAIRDIQPGEEITDEYGLFNIIEEMKCFCGSENCRGSIHPGDFGKYSRIYDEKIRPALTFVHQLRQPLWEHLEPSVIAALHAFSDNPSLYVSVTAQKRVRGKRKPEKFVAHVNGKNGK